MLRGLARNCGSYIVYRYVLGAGNYANSKYICNLVDCRSLQNYRSVERQEYRMLPDAK
jgi:hypothetical protein